MSAFVFIGCKKSGCNDQLATNFDENATKGDASCKYDASVIFWIQDDNQGIYGVDTLLIMIDDVVIGKQSTATTFTVQPECKNAEVIKYHKDMGETVSESFRYRITTKDSLNLKEGQMNIIRSKCQFVSIN